MTRYHVLNKSTGAFITDYESPSGAPIALNGLGFDTTDHVPIVPSGAVDAPTAPLFDGRRKLTKLEWRKLLRPEEEKAFDKIRATVETMALPSEALRDDVRTCVNRFNEATVMDLDDPEQARGFELLVSLGVMAPTRIKEILNG